MSRYLGIYSQIRRNNIRSVFLLTAFPLLVLAMVYAITAIFSYNQEYQQLDWDQANQSFIQSIPWVILVVAIWFMIAYWSNQRLINMATRAKGMSRKEDMRVYNLTENLCIALGMTMPKLQVIEDRGLNAFASWINEKTYTVTLTRGIINTLNDEELEGVIAHELMHIRNRDVRLLVITIVFVGIFSLLVQIMFRSILYGGARRSSNNKGGGAIIVILIVAAIAYFLSLIFKFALSRKREYMADAGAAEVTKNPKALASALRKISGNSRIENLASEDVKDMFIDNYPDKPNEGMGFLGGMDSLFSTHPPIKKRIEVLEGF